ncbi:MAG: hypothetical protein ACYTJ0_10760 [Planctomycetota bacterium]|jgi:hypothetical protein
MKHSLRSTEAILATRGAGIPGLLLVVITAMLCGFVQSHPTPAGVPYRWELIFEPGKLRLYIDPIDQQPYWYFTYKVTNRTGKVRVWAPKHTLFTDVGEILPAGRDVPTRVTADLLDLLGNPLLEDQNQVIGDIHHGRENAKEGLVVWPARKLNANRVSLFTSGISGETARVRNPVSGDEVILRKTLERQYLVRGEMLARSNNPVEFVGDRWIMR